MTENELFESKVIPIMDEVAKILKQKQVEELRKDTFSILNIMRGSPGPDGGITTSSMDFEKLRMNGEWNSKKVEDYISMVKEALTKNNINISPSIEKMMIDKMVQDQMPKSSIEYIMRKAGNNTIFGIAAQLNKSPLQQEIDTRGEELYNPSNWEKGVGWGVGAASDFLAFGGSGIGSGIRFIGADIAVNALIDKDDEKERSGTTHDQGKEAEDRKDKYKDVPLVVEPGHEDEWLALSKEDKRQTKKEETRTISDTEENHIKERSAAESHKNEEQGNGSQKNTNGWPNVLSAFGLNGISDIGHNAGYILAMLPDILIGIFTGKTQSLGIKDNLIPLASIMAGMFVNNPLLKMTLIGMGGANLINKAGHEELDRREPIISSPQRSQFRQYADEPLNPRISNPQINGNSLIATIDKKPVAITIPKKVAEAYEYGALPLNTLANAVLEKTDQMQQLTSAQERFEDESRTITRTISQR